MVCNWYEDDKGIRMTEKKRDKVYADVRKTLSYVIRDKKNLYYPGLIRRERRVETAEPVNGGS